MVVPKMAPLDGATIPRGSFDTEKVHRSMYGGNQMKPGDSFKFREGSQFMWPRDGGGDILTR